MHHNQSTANDSNQSHMRINDTLLGSSEKKVLNWLAARMPSWVVPDTLTMFGLSASFLIFFSYALTIYSRSFLWLASVGFILQWFGDSLDGTLARYRKIERPRYGFFVDHAIDEVSEVLIFLGLGLSPYLRFDLAMLALISYLLMSTYVYLVTYVNGIFRISYARLGPTEVRVLAIIGNIVVFFAGNPIFHLHTGPGTPLSLTFYDLIAVAFTLLVAIMFVYNTIATAMYLSLEDRAEAHARKLQLRAARRQALRDERAMRKATANQARAQNNRTVKSITDSTRLKIDP